MTEHRLDIFDSEGRPVANTLQRSGTAQHLVVVFPGRRYTAQAPALHYCTCLALELGADVLAVEYGSVLDVRADLATLCAQVEHIATATLAAADDYARTTVIGKSLGVIATTHALMTSTKLADAQAVLLTPPLNVASLRAQLASIRQRSLLVIGTDDPHYSPENISAAQAAGELVVLDGANHGLDVPGSVEASLGVIANLVQAVRAFLTV